MKKSRAFSIIVAIVVIFILATLGVAGLSLLVTEAQIAADIMLSSKAFFIAEGGLEYYTTQLNNQTTTWTTPPAVPSNKALGGGAFWITTANVTANEMDVISEGRITGPDGETVVRAVRAHVTRLSGAWNVPEAFYYACYVQNHINFGNDATATSTISGDLKAKMNISIGSGWTHTGSSYPSSTLEFPWCDFDAYETWVEDNYGSGHVKSGNYTFTTAGSPYSGVYFVGGNASIDPNVTINGGIVTTGGINMNSAHGSAINAISGEPALVAEQAINIQNSANVQVTGEGLIYAEAGISIRNVSGGSTFNGTFIADNNFTVSGGSTENIHINYTSDLVVNPPPFFTTEDTVGINWLETYSGGY